MSKRPVHARARETGGYRQKFTLSVENMAALAEAAEADFRLGDEGRSRTNEFWSTAGAALGFIWTTVEGYGEASPGEFTAEVPDVVPPRDDSAAEAWIRAQPKHMRRDGEPFGDFELGDMIEAWHAGREAGLQVGVGIGRLEIDQAFAEMMDLEELMTEADSLVRSIGDSRGERLGVIVPLFTQIIRRQRKELRERASRDRADREGVATMLEMRHDADMRAVKRWQAGEPDPHVRALVEAAMRALAVQHNGDCVLAGYPELRDAVRALPATWRVPAEQRELMWPDHADLVCWLLAKVEAMEKVTGWEGLFSAAQMARKLGEAGPLGVSRSTSVKAADLIDGLMNIICAQQRKIASLEAHRWQPVMDSRPRHVRGWDFAGNAGRQVEMALDVLDRYARGDGPFTSADAARVAKTIRSPSTRQIGTVTVGLSANGLALLKEAAATFREYERHHRDEARGLNPGGSGRSMTPKVQDRIAKAERNARMAERIEAEIATALKPHSFPDADEAAGVIADLDRERDRYDPPADVGGIRKE